jgi:hypothetical protein
VNLEYDELKFAAKFRKISSCSILEHVAESDSKYLFVIIRAVLEALLVDAVENVFPTGR